MQFREENNYLDIARHIIDEGYIDKSRTGIDIYKIHSANMTFSLADGRVPIVSTREIDVTKPIIEMCWFARGDTRLKFLKDHNCGIWDSWVIPGTAVYDQEIDVGLRMLRDRGLVQFGEELQTKAGRSSFMMKYGPGLLEQLLKDLTGVDIPQRRLLDGSIGEGAYGAQWRHWEDIRVIPYGDEKQFEALKALGYKDMEEEMFPGAIMEFNPELRVVRREYDQLQNAIDLIKNNPESRRIIVSAWNPGRLDLAALPPCHMMFQFLPFEKDGVKYLDLDLTCRSQDFLVGTVFNVMQYGVLAHLVAKLTGRKANKLYWSGKNTHIYMNQVEIFNEEHRERSPENNQIRLHIDEAVTSIDDIKPEHFKVTGYDNFLEKIKYPVAV